MQLGQEIPISVITDSDRIRTDLGDLASLKFSIREFGIIQPIVLAELDGRWELIVGGRRLEAMRQLGFTSLRYGQEFIFRSDLDDAGDPKIQLRRKSIELEENLKRKDMTWPEVVRGKSDLLRIMQEIRGTTDNAKMTRSETQAGEKEGFGIRSLAALLGESVGTVSQDLQIASVIEIAPSIAKLDNKTMALTKIRSILRTHEFTKLKASRIVAPGEPSYDIHTGDALTVLKTMPSESINCCVTSPPYYMLRNYGSSLGREPSPSEFVDNLASIFSEVRRTLKPDGTLWVVIGDTYSDGSLTIGKKNLIGIPWMFAFAMRNAGWILRQDIIWSKPNPVPESVLDRCTTAHEYVFLFAKSESYFFDATAISEPSLTAPKQTARSINVSSFDKNRKDSGRKNMTNWSPEKNKRSVWVCSTNSSQSDHFATFPIDLITPCLLAGTSKGDIVLDPFSGSGTTGVASLRHGRNFVGIELNSSYVDMALVNISAELSRLDTDKTK